MIKIIVFVITILVAIIIYFLITKRTFGEQSESVEILTAENLIGFFKQPFVLCILKENPDYVAVAIKDDNIITCAIYNKKDEQICCMDKSTKQFRFKKLDSSVSEMFGDKKMIILQ